MRQNGSERELGPDDVALRSALADAMGHRIAYTYDVLEDVWPVVAAEKELWDRLARDANRAAVAAMEERDVLRRTLDRIKDAHPSSCGVSTITEERDAAREEVARLKSLLAEFGSGPPKESANERDLGAEPWEYGWHCSGCEDFFLAEKPVACTDAAVLTRARRTPEVEAGDWEVAP